MHLRTDHDTLRIELSFWEQIWGMHGSWSIPLSHVKGIHEGRPATSWKELRVPGTYVPGVIKAGTYFTPRGKEYWYVVRGRERFCTIELEGERYERLVLSLPPGETPPRLPS